MTGPSSLREATPRQLLAFAAIFAAAGAGLAWAAYTRHPALRVPPAIGYVVAVVCLLTSAATAAKVAGRQRLVNGLAAALLVGMSVIGGWIALGSDGACRTNLPVSGAARAVGCRVGFGVGALITAAMAAGAIVVWWRGRGRP